MTELEKAALEVYPKNISYSTIIDQMFDYNAEKRNIWINGAKWAIDKACKWIKNSANNKPQLRHSVLMKTTHGIAEGEWNGKEWIQYRWSSKIKDSDVLYWMSLCELEKQGELTQSVTKTGEQVWSEEDEAMLNQAIEEVEYALNDKNLFYTGNENVLDWLKSLKDRLKGGMTMNKEDKAKEYIPIAYKKQYNSHLDSDDIRMAFIAGWDAAIEEAFKWIKENIGFNECDDGSMEWYVDFGDTEEMLEDFKATMNH